MLITGKGLVLSARLAARTDVEVRTTQRLVDAAYTRARAGDVAPAAVEVGVAMWRQWAAAAGLTVDELAPVLARLVGCSAETVCRALAA